MQHEVAEETTSPNVAPQSRLWFATKVAGVLMMAGSGILTYGGFGECLIAQWSSPETKQAWLDDGKDNVTTGAGLTAIGGLTFALGFAADRRRESRFGTLDS